MCEEWRESQYLFECALYGFRLSPPPTALLTSNTKGGGRAAVVLEASDRGTLEDPTTR